MLFSTRFVHRLSQLLLLALIGLVYVAAPSRAAAHPDVPAPTGEPQHPNVPAGFGDWVSHHYHLFAATCYEAPTPLQQTTLDTMESIFTLMHGWRQQPPGADEYEALRAKVTAHAQELTRTYPLQRLTLHANGIKTDALTSMTLTAGLSGAFMVEINNAMTTAASLAVQVLVTTASQPSAPWGKEVVIPPGQMRPLFVPLRLTSSAATTVALLINGQSQQPLPFPATQIALPVRVVEPARVTGTLIEAATGKPIPGRVHARGSDGILRHGEAYKENKTLSEKQVVFRPAMQKLPFFYSDGHFEVLLPPGPATLTLERGFEHPLVSETIELQAGETKEVKLTSGRFLDMAAQGWVSGDTHIHWAVNTWDANEDINLLAMAQRAEDLRVANNLTLYQYRPAEQGGTFIKPDQYPMGPVRHLSDADYHIEMAEEYRNDGFWGHVNLLNIKELLQPIATGAGSGGPPDAIDYPLNKTIIEQTHAQGGIAAEAHDIGPFNASAVPIHVLTGLSDVLDQLSPVNYYNFLNCGVHIGLGNGSDHPARVIGCARVYVKSALPWTYQSWIDGLREGRSFTTSGPLLFLTLEHAGSTYDIGDRLQPKGGDAVRLVAHARSRFPIGKLEIVSNGEILATTSTQATEARLELPLTLSESRWFAARCGNGPGYSALLDRDTAHTSAIYAEIGGKPVLKPEAARVWVQNLKIFQQRMLNTAKFATAEQRAEAEAFVAEGIREYELLAGDAEPATK